ncbi:MAG: class I SAM-dependent methyltransferase [Pyrinomonadaceae bacterium]
MTEIKEDLWGYAKRLRFTCASIDVAFLGKAPSDLRVLDVGCGSATQLGLPLARLGYRLTGIDTHESSIAKATELAHDLPNANFICGNVEEIKAEPFDVVIISEVLEHVAEPEKLLRSSLNHLQKNGLVIVTVPNGFGEFEWDSWVFRVLGLERLIERYESRRAEKKGVKPLMSSTENKENRHIQFFTQRRLREIFRACSLTVVNKNASTLMSGPFVGHTLARFAGFIEWNAQIADKLPMTFSSSWFFALRRVGENEE